MVCPAYPNVPALQVIVSAGPSTNWLVSDVGNVHPTGNGPEHPPKTLSQTLSLKSSKKGNVNCENAVTGVINNKKIIKGDELLI